MLKINRKGQTVVEVVILISFSLIVVIATTYFAFNVLEYQSELSEYEAAKSALEKLTLLIENVANSEGSSGYVPIYVRAGSLYLVSDSEPITIRVNGQTLYSDNDGVSLIKFMGGRLVGTANFRLIIPTSQDLQLAASLNDIYTKYLIIDSSKGLPLGWIYEMQKNGAYIVVDFGRIMVTYSGVFNYSYIVNGSVKFKPYNVVEVSYIKLIRGSTYGSGSSLKVVAKCKDISFNSTLLSTNSLTFVVTRGSNSQSYVLNELSSFNGSPVSGTIVNFSLIEVEISSY
ncbi:MAG: hypothetical protein QXS21_01340 [Thermoproteota archaeon]|nr:hypothetical protein [Candidatus Brockarchaeota archaeon]MBO3768671.1 hypothetical protein [Candidatus Brockarchaeota archaeon]MBO3801237.1 hypothetical protein [Candidatus Brockarchaeota archaeon]